MPRIHVEHRTTYRYANPVQLLPHRLMLRPQDSHDLRLHEATLTLGPAGATTRWAHDVFGNSVCHVSWPEETRATALEILSTLDLTHYPSGTNVPAATLDPVAETYPFSYAAEEAPDLARLTERHYPDPERLVDQWAKGFLNQNGPTKTLDLLAAMTSAIKRDFTYAGRDAEGTNTPEETLRSKAGACRDFALLMMEAVRALGFAAHFVSGYLYDADAEGKVVGGGATHAWVGVYLPGAGWVEYDPTNGLLAGRNLIRVSVSRTPEQSVPVGGGFLGGSNDFMGLTVDVSVRVAPEAEAPKTSAPLRDEGAPSLGPSEAPSPTPA